MFTKQLLNEKLKELFNFITSNSLAVFKYCIGFLAVKDNMYIHIMHHPINLASTNLALCCDKQNIVRKKFS
jgi:hypothetical protein